MLADGERFVAFGGLACAYDFKPDWITRLCRSGEISGRRVDRN